MQEGSKAVRKTYGYFREAHTANKSFEKFFIRDAHTIINVAQT